MLAMYLRLLVPNYHEKQLDLASESRTDLRNLFGVSLMIPQKKTSQVHNCDWHSITLLLGRSLL